MTRTSNQLLALLNNISVLDCAPIAQALQGSVVFSNTAGQTQSGFAITYGGVTYLVTTVGEFSIANINTVMNYNGVSASVTMSTKINTNIQLCVLPTANNFNAGVVAVTWYDENVLEGLEIYAIGSQMTQALLSSTPTLPLMSGSGTGYGTSANATPLNLNFSVTEGIISRITAPLSPSFGGLSPDNGPYLRHTAALNPYSTNDLGGSFGGPLFTMNASETGTVVNVVPALVGMNVWTFWEDPSNPGYLGISFALPIQTVINNIISII